MLPPTIPLRKVLVVLAVVVAAAGAMALWRLQPTMQRDADAVEIHDEGTPVTGLEEPQGRPEASAPSTITVHVAGPVARPGVIVLPHGARVADAIAAAGGLLPGTSSGVNLARPLADGERLDTAAPAAPEGPAPGPAGSGEQRIDLNAATAQELEALPGVGPVLAQRIVDYRQEHGGFESVDQLQEVSGIGASRAADLADQVFAGPSPGVP